MRQNLVVVLLAVVSTLLAVHLAVDLMRGPEFPVAFGQAAAAADGGVLMATANTQTQAFLFIYDIKGTKLACYAAGNQGLEIKGVRELKWDLDKELQEFPVSDKPTAVKNMKKVIEKAGKP